MADPKNDDIADALAAFASGDAAEPQTPLPARPTPKPAPMEPRPLPPVSRPVSRAPTSRPRAPQPTEQPAYIPEPAEEDAEDPLASRGAAPATSVSAPIRRQNYAPNLEARRTLIPILLTCGVLLLVFAGLKYVMDPDSPFASMPGLVTGSAVGMGVLLLIAAAVNMLGVKSALRHAQR